MLFINATHESSSWWKDFIDEDEDSLLWRQFDALADDIYELTDGEICWNEIFLLVDGSDV